MHGGKYNPGFGFENLFQSFEKKEKGWSNFSEILKDNPANENIPRTIKQMKGEKNILETVMNSKNKELLLQNENVLKFFVYDKLVGNKNNQGME